MQNNDIFASKNNILKYLIFDIGKFIYYIFDFHLYSFNLINL